jgi:uncharacterized protein (DUF924 family)
MTNAKAKLIERVLSFWFGAGWAAAEPAARPDWFTPSPDFDGAIARAFGGDVERAMAGDFADLTDSPEGSVALVILLDQFTRNLFRGTARAFSADARARTVARRALERGFDLTLPPVMRVFLYLPFEHSEDLADQQRSVVLFETLDDAEWLDYAIRHRDIIARFGRFPHRNVALGRPSSAEEIAFLKTPNSSF